jgi:hypothetical protein
MLITPADFGSPSVTSTTCTSNYSVIVSDDYCLVQIPYLIYGATRHRAMHYCQSFGGTLVIYNSKTDQVSFKSVIPKGKLQTPYWIGLEQPDISLPWTWGGVLPLTYTSWKIGEPSNIGNRGCVLESGASLAWTTQGCTTLAPFACKLPTVPPVYNCSADCCYHMYSKAYTWDNASNTCLKYGGRLVRISSDYEQQYILNTFISPGERVWIGASVQGVCYFRILY